ncbi:MAG: arginine--tRNA ligase [Planctomycetota bacterium]|nr:arginine--tRNA ligase [Planctomycetota bacterium]
MIRNPFHSSILSQLSQLTEMESDEINKILQGPADARVGDYSLPCFILAKQLKKNPAQIASELAGRFVPDAYVDRAEATGPYLNIFLNRPAFMEQVLRNIHQQGKDYGSSDAGNGKTITIDFSSPNIAKPLGVHHLCSTMIGNSIYRSFKALGYNVVGVNHLGDWGTQFGVMLSAFMRWGDSMPEDFTVNDLVELYQRYSREMAEDETMAAEAREWFLKLEQGDEVARKHWKRFREVSLREFERVYERLDVHFDSFAGESFYNDKMDSVLERIEGAGLSKISRDALVVDLEDYGMPPCILKKSDEATLYATRDLAAIEFRKAEYNFDKNLYVVGADQRLHFQQLFKVLELLGDEVWERCHHIDFGLVLFKAGDSYAKSSTRKGNLELLEDVLDRAADLALGIINENEKKLNFETGKEEIAESIGIAAVVFGILSTSRQKDVKFDWDEILSFRGRTGPYLQYAHARQASIIRKHNAEVTDDVKYDRLDDEEEFGLAKLLDQLPDIIATYLLDLAAAYSTYSQDSKRHKVISEDEELTAARVLLVSCIRTVLQRGLWLLGIKAPQQM